MAVGASGVSGLFWKTPVTAGNVAVWAEPGVLQDGGGAPIIGFGTATNPGVNLTGSAGVATTAMRSDTVLVLDQSIVPTWTGLHTFNAALTTAAPLQIIQSGISTTTSTINSLGAAGTGNITVASSAGFPSPGFFWVDSEILKYTVVDGTTLNVSARGRFQSTAAAHANASTIAFVTFITAASETSAPQIVIISGSPTGQGANPVFIHPFAGALGNDGSLTFRTSMIQDGGGSGFLIQGGTGVPVDIATTSTKRARFDTSGNFFMAATGSIGFNSTTIGSGAQDLFLTRATAAVLQMGAANAASPVAQALQAQGSRPGTDSNVAGANLTIQPGNGVGTPGTSSALIFMAPLNNATATTAQTQTEVIRLQGGATPVLKWSANNSTGAGAALLGANSPASTLAAPYTWVTVQAGDGSTCYLPIWK